MQVRKRYDNPTSPRRCGAIIFGPPSDVDGKRESNPCRKRIFKRGVCVEHHTDRVNAGENRRLTVTRHRIGYDDKGKMTYGTIKESGELNWCSGSITCRYRPVINIDGMIMCMRHFEKEQKLRSSKMSLNGDIGNK